MRDTAAPTVGAVVLAAGESTRFPSGNKLLEPLDGTPVVTRVGRIVAASTLTEGVGIVGHEAAAVEDALAGTGLAIRHNEDYAAGQSSSVRCGVEYAVDAGWDAAVFLLGDMPFVDPSTVDRLVDAYADERTSIVVPRFEGTRGNPVLFDASHFEALAATTGDRGGRHLIETEDGTLFLDVDDPGVRQDLDDSADFDRHRT